MPSSSISRMGGSFARRSSVLAFMSVSRPEVVESETSVACAPGPSPADTAQNRVGRLRLVLWALGVGRLRCLRRLAGARVAQHPAECVARLLTHPDVEGQLRVREKDPFVHAFECSAPMFHLAVGIAR